MIISNMTDEERLAYWEKRMASTSDPGTASWPDRYALDLECAALRHVLDKHSLAGRPICELGAGLGYHSMRLLPRVVTDATLAACAALNEWPYFFGRVVSWDLLQPAPVAVREKLGEEPVPAVFVAVRVFMNIGDFPRALKNVGKAMRKGDHLLMIEGCIDGRSACNLLRAQTGMAPLKPPAPANIYRYYVNYRTATARAGLEHVASYAHESVYMGMTRALFARQVDALGAGCYYSSIHNMASMLQQQEGVRPWTENVFGHHATMLYKKA